MALVANQTGKRGKACLPVETNRVRSRKTVGDLPADPSPEGGHQIHNSGGGCHTAELYRGMGASRDFARGRQRCGGRPILGGEWRLTVANVALARESWRERWALGLKDRVQRKPSHLKQAWG